MRRLFVAQATVPDVRPALLSVVSLMVLLLPFLLLTTSVHKLTGLPLSMPGPSETLPPEPPGPVEQLRVTREASGYVVTAAVRNTDVLAGVGDTEAREITAGDLTELQEVLATFKVLDPDRERITLVPAADSTTDEVVRWMDAVKAGPSGELYSEVILETSS